jgi:polyketide cyclase/dehydrase/lipid transport protein
MKRSRFMGLLFAPLALSLLISCQRKPSIDWSAKENFFAFENVGKNEDDSVRLEFHSLVDAPADAAYQALAEPENYSVFVQGVTDSGKISTQGNTRVIHITQNVIGRQTRAQLKYTFHPDQKKIEFETLQSDTTFNDGSYEITPSPDGKRCYVVSIFNVREKSGQKMPPGVVVSATRESFLEAARSVKARALGQNLKVKTG